MESISFILLEFLAEHTQQGLHQLRRRNTHLQSAILCMACTVWHRRCFRHLARTLSRSLPFVKELNLPAHDI